MPDDTSSMEVRIMQRLTEMERTINAHVDSKFDTLSSVVTSVVSDQVELRARVVAVERDIRDLPKLFTQIELDRQLRETCDKVVTKMQTDVDLIDKRVDRVEEWQLPQAAYEWIVTAFARRHSPWTWERAFMLVTSLTGIAAFLWALHNGTL